MKNFFDFFYFAVKILGDFLVFRYFQSKRRCSEAVSGFFTEMVSGAPALTNKKSPGADYNV
jgi:hypothetical protein